MQNIYKFHPFSNSFFSYGGHAELEPILAAFGGNVGSKQVAVHRRTRIERHTTIYAHTHKQFTPNSRFDCGRKLEILERNHVETR